jgi:hypothetical protein
MRLLSLHPGVDHRISTWPGRPARHGDRARLLFTSPRPRGEVGASARRERGVPVQRRPVPLSRRALRPRRPLPANGARHRAKNASALDRPLTSRGDHVPCPGRRRDTERARPTLHLAPAAGRGRRVCAPGEGSSSAAAPGAPLPSARLLFTSPRPRGEVGASARRERGARFSAMRTKIRMLETTVAVR